MSQWCNRDSMWIDIQPAYGTLVPSAFYTGKFIKKFLFINGIMEIERDGKH